MILNSKFGFAPKGQGLHSFRLTETLASGAIPIILADGFIKPYNIHNSLNWDEFSLTIPEADVLKIPEMLSHLPMEKILQMQTRAMEVYQKYFESNAKMIKFSFEIIAKKFLDIEEHWNLTAKE